MSECYSRKEGCEFVGGSCIHCGQAFPPRTTYVDTELRLPTTESVIEGSTLEKAASELIRLLVLGNTPEHLSALGYLDAVHAVERALSGGVTAEKTLARRETATRVDTSPGTPVDAAATTPKTAALSKGLANPYEHREWCTGDGKRGCRACDWKRGVRDTITRIREKATFYEEPILSDTDEMLANELESELSQNFSKAKT